MAFKIVIFSALVAAASAGLLGAPIAQTYTTGAIASPLGLVRSAPIAYAQQAPLAVAAPVLRSAPLAVAHAPVAVAHAAPVAVAEEYDPNPQYSYGYDVQDALTGDSKSQVESRNGDVVQGSYSLVDPDGTRRTVDYTADPINGFNAVVHKEPLVQKAVVAAPAIAKVAAPIAVASPVLRAAPVAVASPLLRAGPVAGLASPYGLAGGLGYASPLAYSSGLIH